MFLRWLNHVVCHQNVTPLAVVRCLASLQNLNWSSFMSQMDQIHTLPLYIREMYCSIIHSCLALSLRFRRPNEIAHVSHPSYARYMPVPSYHWFDHREHFWPAKPQTRSVSHCVLIYGEKLLPPLSSPGGECHCQLSATWILSYPPYLETFFSIRNSWTLRTLVTMDPLDVPWDKFLYSVCGVGSGFEIIQVDRNATVGGCVLFLNIFFKFVLNSTSNTNRL